MGSLDGEDIIAAITSCLDWNRMQSVCTDSFAKTEMGRCDHYVEVKVEAPALIPESSDNFLATAIYQSKLCLFTYTSTPIPKDCTHTTNTSPAPPPPPPHPPPQS